MGNVLLWGEEMKKAKKGGKEREINSVWRGGEKTRKTKLC